IRDAAALELREVRDLRTAIARAGGDDDGTGADPAAIGELQDVHRIRTRACGGAVQPLDFSREAELGPEFLRLRERASHQRLSRYAGGKAEIVLDARARAGLSSEHDRLQHHDGEAL